jgi:hypothetical protein
MPGVAVCCHLFRFWRGQCADVRTVQTMRLAGGEACAACPPWMPFLSHACRVDNDTCGLFWRLNVGCREASPERARHYLKLAAAQGSAEANGMLGGMYVSGCGAPGGRQTMKNATEGLGAPPAAEAEPFSLVVCVFISFSFDRRQRPLARSSSHVHPRTSILAPA